MHEYTRRLQEAIASSTSGLSRDDLVRHPEGKWSMVEVLEHLYLSYTGTVKGCERSLAEGKPLVSPASFKQRLKVLVVVTAGHMPGGLEAPKMVRPKGMPADQVLGNIGPQIVAMDELIGRCEARFGAQTKFLNHPVLGPLTGSQWRKFHWVHGWHHIKQILRLREGWGLTK